MLQLKSRLTVADNSGAKLVELIGIPGRGNRKYAYVGEVISVVVKKADPFGNVKSGEKCRAVIIRCRKETKRSDGSYIRFDDNACVLLLSKDSTDPRGSRFFGPVARELKDAGFNKIISNATEVF